MTMTIKQNKLTAFVDVEKGSAFVCNNITFLKVRDVDHMVGYDESDPLNVVGLLTGDLYYFNCDDLVEVVAIEMTVSPAK